MDKLTGIFLATVLSLPAIAPAAIITAEAAVRCSLGGVVTTDSTTANGTTQAVCDTTRASFEATEWGAAARLYVDGTPGGTRGLDRNEARVSVAWSNRFLLTGGTGVGMLQVSVSNPSFLNEVYCRVEVDNVRVFSFAADCPSEIPVPFNVPFTVRLTMDGDNFSCPGCGYRAGLRLFFLDPGLPVTQNGIAVAGASLAPVPEPASWAAMGLGLMSLVLVRRAGGFS